MLMGSGVPVVVSAGITPRATYCLPSILRFSSLLGNYAVSVPSTALRQGRQVSSAVMSHSDPSRRARIATRATHITLRKGLSTSPRCFNQQWTVGGDESQEVKDLLVVDGVPISDETRQLYEGVIRGNRRAVSKAITLDRAQAHHLLSLLLVRLNRPNRSASRRTSFRIGFTGPPGVGKSTFIEAFGTWLVKSQNRRLAVLAIDPSSSRTGGSILGDKTRMDILSREDGAYVRPTPSGGTLGGVARNTQEAMVVCEAAGFDTIFVESVGVGQSEVILADMVDMYVLLVPPAGGDELQGIKRGIMELVDLVIVNKADGELEAQAIRTQTDYRSALMYLPPLSSHWRPRATRVSSVTRAGLDACWSTMLEFHRAMTESGELSRKRGRQYVRAMWRQIGDELLGRLKRSSIVEGMVGTLEWKVRSGEVAAGRAADVILGGWW
ncbi:hypothetical protein HDU93_005171 [Gonapodya sp. JEL0774]|nr:hypothetical protein HDU93_005171 [Gonapodya sp. JEL0774]